MGLAIGKNGKNIERLQKMIGYRIEVVEDAETPKGLIKNSLFSTKINSKHFPFAGAS